MATTNFQQWNPTASNQESDAAYTSDAQRVGGASSGEFPSQLANKLFYQLSTFIAALGQMLSTKGYATSDVDISALAAVLANLITNADLARLSVQATRTNMIGSYSAGSTYTNLSGEATFQEVTMIGPQNDNTGRSYSIRSIIAGSNGPTNSIENYSYGYAYIGFWVPAGATFSVTLTQDTGGIVSPPPSIYQWTEVSFGL